MFRPMIRSRHGSHDPLRTMLTKLPFRSVVRLGSTTQLADDVTSGGKRIECNTVEAVKNSASKLRMKQKFTEGKVVSADWYVFDNQGNLVSGVDGKTVRRINELEYPVVTKHIFGSRGTGNKLIQSAKEFEQWLQGKTLSNYIVEKFYNYTREYRLHVTKDGCFYTCRKLLKEDTPDENRWYRNDSNSVWIMEENPSFNKPSNWKEIESECVKALISVGLDVGACDVKTTSPKKEGAPTKFIVIEINSAPSFGENTLQKYLEVIPSILNSKKNG